MIHQLDGWMEGPASIIPFHWALGFAWHLAGSLHINITQWGSVSPVLFFQFHSEKVPEPFYPFLLEILIRGNNNDNPCAASIKECQFSHCPATGFTYKCYLREGMELHDMKVGEDGF
jgi:hypothetical protein